MDNKNKYIEGNEGYTMAGGINDGKLLSKYCGFHKSLEANFFRKYGYNGKFGIGGVFTPEYEKHMKSVLLNTFIQDGKRYAQCPKCFVRVEITK